MTRFALLIVALSALGACAATGADARPPARYAATSCAIREIQGRGGVELTPVVWTQRPLVGSYSFSVDKIGRGGSSTVEQGGALDIDSGGPERLGSVAIGDGAFRYRARLVVRDRAGAVCVATAPGRST